MQASGISLWRQIGEALAGEIESGVLPVGGRLPADIDLAVRFGVNRHTVRRALGYLQNEGLLRVDRGRGTFVVDDVMDYRVGARTRFTENLLHGQRLPSRRLLSLAELPAPRLVAEQLRIAPGARMVLLHALGEADGIPISIGVNHFPATRLPGIAAAFRDASGARALTASITKALAACGVADYRRRSTRISARLPTAEEARHLRQATTRPVVETESLDVDTRDQPVNYHTTIFRADRVQLLVEG